MGSGVSTISEDKAREKEIDRIATDYILSMNFQDMENMTTENGCGKMVLIVEGILKKNTTEVDLSSLDKSTGGLFSLAAPPSGKESIFVFPKDEDIQKKTDVSDPKTKLNMCRNIAKFYVQVAHLFAAIIMTINPKYEYTKDGETKRVGIMERKDIPEGALNSVRIVLEENFCSLRKNILLENSNLNDNSNSNNEISIAVPYCSMDDKITSIGNSRGIKELEALYNDEYDTSTGLFSKSASSDKEYKKMVAEFYNAIYGTGTGTAPNTLSDINMPKDNTKEGCYATSNGTMKSDVEKDDESDDDDETKTSPIEFKKAVFREKYTGVDSGLYRDFKNNIEKMKTVAEKNTTDIFATLGILFDLSKDPITINPKITPENIESLIETTRENIKNLYLQCEIDFQEGLKLFKQIAISNIAQLITQDLENTEE